MTTHKPVSDERLDELLDLAAKAPPYDRTGLIDAIMANATETREDAGEIFVLAAFMRRPLLTSGVALSIAALGFVSGVMPDMLFGDYAAAVQVIETYSDFNASTLLTGGWI